MAALDIAQPNPNDQLYQQLQGMLRDTVILDVLHDETRTQLVLAFYQTQDRATQAIIRDVLHEILVRECTELIQTRLATPKDVLLGDLAFLTEQLNVTKAYTVLRAVIDRGSLGPGPNFFASQATERKVLRALMVLQPKDLLSDHVWQAYWNSTFQYFWPIALLGMVKSNLADAIRQIPLAYLRWKTSPLLLDFPQALYHILQAARLDGDTMKMVRQSLSRASPKDIATLRDALRAKGTEDEVTHAVLSGDTYEIARVQVSRNKPFTIYHHHDLDGIGCAILWALFVIGEHRHNINAIMTVAVDHDVDLTTGQRWWTQQLKTPAAIFDFKYNKHALVFYDHHIDPFGPDPESRKHYDDRLKSDPNNHYIQWVSGETSATKLLFRDIHDALEEYFPNRAAELGEMTRRIDERDSATFSAPGKWVDLESPYDKADIMIYTRRDPELTKRFISDVIRHSFPEVVMSDPYKKLIKGAVDGFVKSKEMAMQAVEKHGNVLFYDSVAHKVEFHRFLPYDKYPNANFVVGIYRKGNAFEVSVGENPHRATNSFVHIGRLCKRFTSDNVRAGGRENVGGITVHSEEQARSIGRRIVSLLQKSEIRQEEFEL